MTTTPDTTTDVQKRLEEIRAREAAATPGHWGTYYDGKGTYTVQAQPRLIPGVGNVNGGDIATLVGEHGDGQTYANARFTAHAREDVPYLLDRVAELTAKLAPSDTLGIERDAVHKRFDLSYANYLVVPRTLLQSMPDEWQAQFVALLKTLDDAFAHVPQAEGYKVEAATEHEVSDLDDEQLAQLGITEDRYRGEAPPEGLDAEDLAEWEEAHENPDGADYYDALTGNVLSGGDLVMLPAVDPVPHYQRGRAYIEPRLGGGE